MKFLCLTELSYWQLKKVSRKQCSTKVYNDDYSHTIKKDQNHLEFFFLLREIMDQRKKHKLAAKRAFFSEESIAYPFVQM